MGVDPGAPWDGAAKKEKGLAKEPAPEPPELDLKLLGLVLGAGSRASGTNSSVARIATLSGPSRGHVLIPSLPLSSHMQEDIKEGERVGP